MVAVPRDLWVKLPLHDGKPCMVGYYSKINAVYECGSGLVGSTSAKKSTYAQQDAAGAKDLMGVLGDVTGLTPQYWVHVDYTVLREAVDAVGGIDVHIVGDGASGIYDTNLDSDACNASGKVSCRHVFYPKNGTYHLSGQQALDLSRARGDANQYAYKDFGLNGGDFDRQANQQKVMVALKEAATSAGVLANPVTVFNLMTDTREPRDDEPVDGRGEDPHPARRRPAGRRDEGDQPHRQAEADAHDRLGERPERRHPDGGDLHIWPAQAVHPGPDRGECRGEPGRLDADSFGVPDALAPGIPSPSPRGRSGRPGYGQGVSSWWWWMPPEGCS